MQWQCVGLFSSNSWDGSSGCFISGQTNVVCCIFPLLDKCFFCILSMYSPVGSPPPANGFSQLQNLCHTEFRNAPWTPKCPLILDGITMFYRRHNLNTLGHQVSRCLWTSFDCLVLILGVQYPGDSLLGWSESKGYKHDKAKIYKDIKPFWEKNKAVKSSSPYLELGGGRDRIREGKVTNYSGWREGGCQRSSKTQSWVN